MWKLWYKLESRFWAKVVRITRDRSVINWPNYSPRLGRLNSFAYCRSWWMTLNYRSYCPCGQCKAPDKEHIFYTGSRWPHLLKCLWRTV